MPVKRQQPEEGTEGMFKCTERNKQRIYSPQRQNKLKVPTAISTTIDCQYVSCIVSHIGTILLCLVTAPCDSAMDAQRSHL